MCPFGGELGDTGKGYGEKRHLCRGRRGHDEGGQNEQDDGHHHAVASCFAKPSVVGRGLLGGSSASVGLDMVAMS